jgi:hypothetical protein
MSNVEGNTKASKRVESSHPLIASDRVQGTNVYRSNGEKIGHVERIMIDKVSGRAAYAVMNFGGFLGLGQGSYPLPWSMLTYNPKLGGYEVNVSEEQLKGAPHFGADEVWDDGTRDTDQTIYGYYGVPPYWM